MHMGHHVLRLGLVGSVPKRCPNLRRRMFDSVGSVEVLEPAQRGMERVQEPSQLPRKCEHEPGQFARRVVFVADGRFPNPNPLVNVLDGCLHDLRRAVLSLTGSI